jgi:hypothetical protein
MRRLLTWATVLGLAAGCGDNGPGPGTGGDLLVSYSGTGDAGAMVVVISGGPVESVTAAGNQQVSFTSPYTNTTRVVILGDAGNGDLLRIRVPDLTQATAYSVRADQVADKTTFALIDPSRHTFSVHR